MGSEAVNRTSVAIEIDDLTSPHTAVVLAAAGQLFGPQDPVDVVLSLRGVDEPTETDGLAVQRACLSASPDPRNLPEILLLGAAESAALPAQVRVTVGTDAAESARAVVLLGAVADAIWNPEPPERSAPTPTLPALTRVTEQLRVARRDVRTVRARVLDGRRPLVVLIFQHRSCWGAVATLCAALACRTEIDFHVVALDSPVEGGRGSTAAFLADQGVRAETPEWLQARRTTVDLIVLDNPYDEVRPDELTVPSFVADGIRVAAVPYGNNAIAGDLMDRLLWDMPLQRSAWRAYLGSPTQAELFARHCTTGAGHARVLGIPKLDRILQPSTSGQVEQWRALADGRPIVLWNPHFRVGPNGWSTFDRYLSPLVTRFASDDRAVLLIRPHFRLFRDLRLMGPQGAWLEREVRRAASASANIVLDESPDYLDALVACDAMMSDLSSLASELLPTGKPILYLHRADGPGLNAEGAYFDAMDRADSFDDVAGFLDRLLAGDDPRRELRAAVSARAFPHADGHAGARLAADIVAGLLGELGEAPASAAPAPDLAAVS